MVRFLVSLVCIAAVVLTGCGGDDNGGDGGSGGSGGAAATGGGGGTGASGGDGGITFGAATHFAAGRAPNSVFVADLNADNIPDLVTANGRPRELNVLLGNGDGSFGAPTAFGAGLSTTFSPNSVFVADLNDDAVPDLITTALRDEVSVFLGNGDGTFGTVTSFETGNLRDGRVPVSVFVADLNADTVPDVVTANSFSSDVSVLLGYGDRSEILGLFEAATTFGVGTEPNSVFVADLNADTVPDVVTANSFSNDVSVLLGNGDGTFGGATHFAAVNSPVSVFVADLNADTVPDLVAGSLAGSDDVSVLLGNGDGTFGVASAFEVFEASDDLVVGASPYSVFVADLNDDTVPDVLTANNFSDDLSVLLGNGDGTFGVATNFGALDNPVSVFVADLNDDTVPDVVTANLFSDNVSVFLGRRGP